MIGIGIVRFQSINIILTYAWYIPLVVWTKTKIAKVKIPTKFLMVLTYQLEILKWMQLEQNTSSVFLENILQSDSCNTGIPRNSYTLQFVFLLIRSSIHVYHTSQFGTFCLANSYFSISFSNKNDVKWMIWHSKWSKTFL